MKLTNVNDYMEIMKQKFPTIKEDDLRRIINYGWRLFYYLNSCGGDVFTQDEEGFWFYCGDLYKDSIKYFKKYINTLVIRLRTLYKRKKIQWDGFYYFALSDEQYNNYMALKKKRGRPRKQFDFGEIFLYKILDECKLRNFGKKYIFKIPYITDIGFKYKNHKLVTEEAQLIIIREPQKFKDILTSTNTYEYL